MEEAVCMSSKVNIFFEAVVMSLTCVTQMEPTEQQTKVPHTLLKQNQ